MKKQVLLVSVFLLSMLLLVSTVSLADNEPMGSFNVKMPKSVDIKSNEYVPLDEVASTIGFEFEWRFNKGKIEGSFGNATFSSDNFIIADGHLYLPISIISDIFGLHIEIRGNKYFIYRRFQPLYGIDLVLKSHKTKVERNEPIAVSILLFNESNRSINLRYTSGKKYDLVLKRYGREVWRLSEGKGFISVLRTETLASGDYLLYTELIQPAENRYMYRGDYELVAEINTTNGTVTSNVVTLTLE